MTGHGIGRQQVHDIDHVLALGLLRRIGSLPGIATVEQQDIAVTTLRANALDDCGDAVETTHLSVCGGQGGEILRGHRISFRCAGLNVVKLQEIGTRHMRRQPHDLADAEVDRWLPKPDRLQLRMNVGDMHHRQIAEILRRKKCVLAQSLLRCRARPATTHAGAGNRRKSNGCGKEFTTGKHGQASPWLKEKRAQSIARVTRSSDQIVGRAAIGRPCVGQCRTDGVSTERPVPRHVT